MLMECLSTGRAISLPAIGTCSIKQALRVTSAYARIRRQFGIAVGIMEGVATPLARMVKDAYKYESARSVTASMVDDGQKPAVISALLKYKTTDSMRDRVNDALDIHGGRAVQDGPSNYLFAGYMTTPVAITVEGANILTRTLITFAQGALRAHPYLYREIEAVQMKDRGAGIKAFDAAFAGHAGFMMRNIAGSFLHAISFGLLASTPVNHEMSRWYRQLARYSQSLCARRRLDRRVPRRRPQAQAAALGPHGRYPRRPLPALGDPQALRGRRAARDRSSGGRCHRARPHPFDRDELCRRLRQLPQLRAAQPHACRWSSRSAVTQSPRPTATTTAWRARCSAPASSATA